MTTTQAETLKAGDRVSYDDGRGRVSATVLGMGGDWMTVQFDDRADTTAIRFCEPEWMQFLTVAQ